MTETELKNRYYKDLLAHVLLTLFTFGIYVFIWIYKTTEFTNMHCEKDKQRNPALMAILCIFVPFFSIYWYYITDDIIVKLDKKERSSDFNIILIITSICFAIVNLIYVQDVINKCFVYGISFVDSVENTVNVGSNNVASVKNSNELDRIDEIKKYKELLDMGAITQEEFDNKKKELLDI